MAGEKVREGEFEVVASGLKFPEGPVPLGDGSVLFVEVASGSLSCVLPSGKISVIAKLGGGPNGAAIGPDGYCYVANNGGFEWTNQNGLLIPGDAPADYTGGRIERVNLATGAFEVVYTHCGGNRLNGPNDLVFDAAGGFWFTDTGKAYARSMDRSGVLYASVDGQTIDETLFPFDRTNGVALSPDERTLYFSETMSGRIWRFGLASPGRLAEDSPGLHPNNLLYGAGGMTGFDSMAVEADGNVCQATLFRGGITVISPGGELIEFVTMPDPFVTNIAFGGRDLRTAYLTLAGRGLLVKTRWPRPGRPLNFVE